MRAHHVPGWRLCALFGLALLAGTGAALLTPVPAARPALPAAAAPACVPQTDSLRTAKRKLAQTAVRKNFTPIDEIPGYEYVKIPPAPAFTESREGVFEAATNRYQAALSAEKGLSFTPKAPGQSGAKTGQVQVRLAAIRRGAETLYDRPSGTDEDEAVEDGSGGLSYWRTPLLEERYQPRGNGVEQSFVLDREPAGKGDLIFTCDLALQGLAPVAPRPGRQGGICFANAQGTVLARYGQVMVRDSARGSVVVEPKLAADGRSLSFAVPENWLSRAAYPVVVDPLVGADFYLGSAWSTPVGAPTIGASSTQWLAVWTDYRDGSNAPRLLGSLVTAGTSSPEFAISTPGLPREFRQQRISAASDGSSFLVVWADDRPVGAGIRGSIVHSDGSLLNGSDFNIALTSGTVNEDPLVTFNGTAYIVAWQDAPSGSATPRIYYTQITPAGVEGSINVLPSWTVPVNQTLQFLAAQKPSGDTLLVFRDNNESPAATRCVRIAPDSSLRDPASTALFNESQTDGGYGRAIGAAFVSSEWHILSSYDQTQDSSVFLHKLSTAGVVTPPSGTFTTMGVSPVDPGTDQYAPVFAGTDEWLFVRNEKVNASVYHLLGKRVTFAGIDKDPVPFQIDTAATGVLRNAVAAQAGSSFLVTWLDGRGAVSQPGDAEDIAAALVDASINGSGGTLLQAAASASPAKGTAPLTVSFDSLLSSGSYDTVLWDFGDGITSSSATVSHTYKNNGVFPAVLKLTKGAYSVYDRVYIFAGTPDGSTGAAAIGTPLQSSAGMVNGLFVSGLGLRLDFTQTGKDTLRVIGFIDPGWLPKSLTGLTATVTVGDHTETFPLDAKGTSSATNATFSVSPKGGGFAMALTNADLHTAMAALGATDTGVKKLIVNVPVTVALNNFTATSTVGMTYTATAKDNGIGHYQFLNDGSEVSGSFLVYKFGASQVMNKTIAGHTFAIKGQVVMPNGGIFKPAATGQFRFVIGNYEVSLPVGQLRNAKGALSYTAKAASGLKKFTLDLNSGMFNLQMIKVPAEIEGGSGLYLAKSGIDIFDADLNFSLQFDLDQGQITAGRYLYLTRKSVRAKAWQLR